MPKYGFVLLHLYSFFYALYLSLPMKYLSRPFFSVILFNTIHSLLFLSIHTRVNMRFNMRSLFISVYMVIVYLRHSSIFHLKHKILTEFIKLATDLFFLFVQFISLFLPILSSLNPSSLTNYPIGSTTE